MSSHPQESTAPFHEDLEGQILSLCHPEVGVGKEDVQPHTPNIPTFFLLPPTLYTDHDVPWSGIGLWSYRVTCPACHFSQPPMPPQPPFQHGSRKSRKSLALCKFFPAITKIFLCYKLCFQHKSKTLPHTSHCSEN